MIGAYCCGSQIETGLSLQCLHATWDALCLTGSWLPQQSCHGLEDSAQPTKALVLLFIPKYCKLGAQCHFRLLTEQWMELMIKTNMQISMHTAGIYADFSITWSSCVPPMKHPRQPERTVAPPASLAMLRFHRRRSEVAWSHSRGSGENSLVWRCPKTVWDICQTCGRLETNQLWYAKMHVKGEEHMIYTWTYIYIYILSSSFHSCLLNCGARPVNKTKYCDKSSENQEITVLSGYCFLGISGPPPSVKSSLAAVSPAWICSAWCHRWILTRKVCRSIWT